MRYLSSLLLALSLWCTASFAAPGRDSISADEFRCPPQQYRLDAWWHWPNGNISRDGIRKDLISMHDAGIKRATILNVNGKGQFVPRVAYASDEWMEMFRYALETADSLGMTIGAHNCDGWSTSGGPWVPVEHSMKTVTWSDSWVRGGRTVDIMLPEPTSSYHYYRDYAVIAVPQKRRTDAFIDSHPRILHNGQETGDVLMDNNPKSFVLCRRGDRLTVEFEQPRTITELDLVGYMAFSWGDIDDNSFNFRLSTSQDGESFTPVGDISIRGANKLQKHVTEPLSAKFFQLECLDYKINVSELGLQQEGESSCYGHPFGNFLPLTFNSKAKSKYAYIPEFGTGYEPVDPSDVIDLTDKMDKDGHLCWKAPKGEWRIIRFGYTVTGVTNIPATIEGQGFESDKMDAAATELHFNALPKKLIEAAGPLAGRVFEFILIDSWECQFTNWTAAFPDEFEALCGYSIKSWLPVLCGEVVGNTQQTEAFLHDFDKTIAALIDRNYYQKIGELARENGIQLHSEPIYGNSAMYPPIDPLKAARWCDMPMTEFWAKARDKGVPEYEEVRRFSRSFPVDAGLTEHKQIIGAEAYTGHAKFSEIPKLLKPFGESAYCAGVNQFILHSYVHQPLDRSPHLTLSDTFGGHYNRNNPWWSMADDWGLYHARVQYVLQHGKTVTDALYYVGDQMPLNYPKHLIDVDLPQGYRANACNYEYLDHMQEDGFERIIIPEGVMLEDRTRAKLSELEAKGVKVYYSREGVTVPFDTVPDMKVLEEGNRFLFIHKRLGHQDAYYVFNQEQKRLGGKFIFRVGGKVPEIWDPESGRTSAPRMWKDLGDGRTMVQLDFKPWQSMFVVFGDSSDAPAPLIRQASLPVRNMQVTMSFEPYYDADMAPVRNDALCLLNSMQDKDIRYFGGIVHYSIRFDAPALPGECRSLALNIGKLFGVARVTLNGMHLKDVWNDDDDLLIDGLRAEGNILEIELGTTLRNRLIGDRVMYGEFVNIKTLSNLEHIPDSDSGLIESGLAGPVTVSVF